MCWITRHGIYTAQHEDFFEDAQETTSAGVSRSGLGADVARKEMEAGKRVNAVV